MPRRRAVIIVPVLVIAALVSAWYFTVGARRGGDGNIVLSGVVDARTIEVGSEVGGRVEALLVREGDRVEAGQIIARISAELTEAKLAQAEAGREAASHLSDRA
ncbi:MAG: biotin/lipoyl-binding protein [Armatimonadetes bacterium]|nr:biotin/lipoyl-binding protein [Armatimonadota bacterium]